ncbi:serine/arginine-rich splicing factor 4-like [Ananas comosus]|uniref:Serine/arginine-rich splicing factor 4-like n=1 Tax=Ananas comosus TaxID=4615 RepID=A0A6P5H330_ANACO|nr:serine/arginine-rich splicing factor 4-like [Ananas comosus]XP_020112269.1 serine/arginine-rich splicing factor 4-like [Ananas comosus]
MSLHIGRLSSHARRGDLERAFRRFGRCSVQLKDGYGFVIYEVIANAERALRALRGKIICGEQISLNWSNRQPQPFQRFTKGSRFNEPYQGKDFSTYNHEVNHTGNAPDKEANEINDDMKDSKDNKSESLKGMMVDEDGAVEPNPLENDRWGENGNESDRYEPYHGYERRDENENENFLKGSSYESPNRGNSQKNRRGKRPIEYFDAKPDSSKPQLICYNCGLVGHIKRNCQQIKARHKEFKFNHRGYEMNLRDRRKVMLKRFRPNSWERSRRLHDGKKFLYEKTGRADKMSDISAETAKLRRDSKRRKRRRLEEEDFKQGFKNMRTGGRRYCRSSRSSDSCTTSSWSCSRSKRSASGTSSSSQSKLASSRSPSQSVSSRLRSASKSSRFQSRSSRTRSRSRSGSRSSSSFPQSLSLSVSLEHKPTPPTVGGQVEVLMNGNDAQNDVERHTLSCKAEYNENHSCGNLSKGDTVVPDKCERNNSLRLTTEELCLALRHYGLETPQEGQLDLSTEEYFGAARLWPWEIVYCRQRKKGPISTENYARRLEQNREYGIVDTYIRSSSGWWECNQHECNQNVP